MSQLGLVLLLSTFLLGGVDADYIFSVHLVSLHNPGHQLVDSRCCMEPLDNQTACSLPCNTTLRICVRDEGLDPANFSCPITELIVAAQSNGEWRVTLPGVWRGSLQLYITVIHDQTAALGALAPHEPVIGELIDSIFIEQLPLSPLHPPLPPLNYTGRFRIATAEMSFSVACTYQFFGRACDIVCPLGRNDSLGRYRCDSNGTLVCLEGYEDISRNCTTCIPAAGCSEVGGFCNYPGECICRQGFTGPTCSENVTDSNVTSTLPPSSSLPITHTPSTSTPSPSLTLSQSSSIFVISTPASILTASTPSPPSLTLTLSPPSLTLTPSPPSLTLTPSPPSLTLAPTPPSLTLTPSPPSLTLAPTPPSLTLTPSPPSLTLTPSPPSFILVTSTSNNQLSTTTLGENTVTTTLGENTVTTSSQLQTVTRESIDSTSLYTFAVTSSPTSAAVTVNVESTTVMIVDTLLTASSMSHTVTVSTMNPTPSPIPPTTGPVLPSPPSIQNLVSLILGSILGALFLMILVSLVIFFISLTLTCLRKRQRKRLTKRRIDIMHRSQPVDSILVNMAATNHQDNTSHSDLDHSLDEHPDMFCNPTYTTFLHDSGTFTQETQPETDAQNDRESALEVGTRKKHNLAELEHSLELKFQEVDTSEMSIGEDLLGSIQQSLSQAGGCEIKQLSSNNEHLDSMDLGSDYAPSFIYTDIFVEEDNSAFRTPSLSPDTDTTPQS